MHPDVPAFSPAVDLVIAVHSTSRPIGRAVESAALAGLDLNVDGGLRINVVCHNIDTSPIQELIPEPLRERVRFLQCRDGVPSPAGPFNAGLDAATAQYASIMGSDDMLEPGSLRQWLEVAQRHGSAAVLAPQRHATGAKVRTPPVRVGRRHGLDPIKDRLSYRTAPLGLLETAEIRRLGLRFTPGYRTGEDQEFSSKLYFGGGRLDYARGAGHYVVGADAVDRVTSELRPVSEEFRFALCLVDSAWFKSLPGPSRRAIVTKLIRVHVFAAASSRDASAWTGAERAVLAAAAHSILAAAPDALHALSVADARLFTAITDPGRDSADLVHLGRLRRKFGTPATLLASRATAQFSPEAPLRFMVASALI